MTSKGKGKSKKVSIKSTESGRSSGSHPVQLAGNSQAVAANLDDVTPIIQFLEQFRLLSDPRAQHKSKLISIKIPEPLLAAFKFKSAQEKIPYQTMIKRLMMDWLRSAK